MLTERCFKLIKKYEGLRLKPYICPAGYWTIGYGKVITKEQAIQLSKGITKEQAEEWLKQEVYKIFYTIFPWIYVSLHPYCWDAITSFSYNVGCYAFKASSLRKKINRKEFYEASNEFLKWVYGGGRKLRGLEIRRKEERELFLEGVKLTLSQKELAY